MQSFIEYLKLRKNDHSAWVYIAKCLNDPQLASLCLEKARHTIHQSLANSSEFAKTHLKQALQNCILPPDDPNAKCDLSVEESAWLCKEAEMLSGDEHHDSILLSM